MSELVPAPYTGQILTPLERLRSVTAQPLFKRALPWFIGVAAIGGAGLTYALLAPAPQRILYSELGDSERASVASALDKASIAYRIDNSTGVLSVDEDNLYRARMLLASDGGLATPQSGARALRRELTALAGSVILLGAAAGAPRTLADLGLATTRDGSFRLDTARLTATLKADARGAAAFFTPGLYGVYASLDRIARSAATAGNPGSLAGSISRYTAQQGKVTLDQSRLTEAQEKLRAQLTSRFATSESRVGASRSTLSFLQNQIDAWNSSGN